MVHNTLGLAQLNGQPGLRERNTGAAATAALPRDQTGRTTPPIPRRAPRTPGQPPQQGQPAAQPKGAIPQFKDNPLAALGVVFQEIAAGQRGTAGPVARAEAAALQQQGLKLRTQAAVLNGLEAATKTIPRLTPDQIASYVKNFPDIEGTGLRATVKAFADGELEGLDQTIARLKADPFAVMFMGSVDLSGKSPAEVKAVADKVLAFKAELQGKRITEAATREGEIKTAVAKQEALAPGIIDLEGKKAAARQKAKGGKESALLKGGAIKSSVTAELRKVAGIAHGGTVIDELTGEVTGLNREQSENVVKVIAEAESLIQAGKATSAAAAVQQAVKTVGLPEVLDPEIQISAGMREQLLDQRVEVTVLKGFAEDLLGQVSLGTGALSNLKAAMDATLGQVVDMVSEGVFFQDTQEAREDIRLFNQEVKRAIVNNPKFPVAEQTIVQKLLTDPAVWFKNPSTAVVNFRQLTEWLDRKAAVTGSLLAGKIPRSAKGGDSDELKAEVDRILGIK